MQPNQHAIVGIAEHFDRRTRVGAWAVVLRVQGREVALHGVLPRGHSRDGKHYATRQAISSLRRLRAPLRALQVTHDVKQALDDPHLRGPRSRAWLVERQWWKSVKESAGIHVTRRPNDAYSAAQRIAEITALSRFEKLKLTEEELDTPWNREYRAQESVRKAEAAERRADRDAARTERKQSREQEEVNEYAIATGRESPPPDYRPSRSMQALMSRAPHVPVAAPIATKAPATPGRVQATSLEELMAMFDEL